MSTKPEMVATIIRLRSEGMSVGAIAKKVGMSKSTVGDIVKRAGPITPAPAPARATEGPDPFSDEPSDNRTSESDTVRKPRYTPKVAEQKIETLLKLAVNGYREAHAQTDIPYDKKVWCEVQYMKVYKEAVKMIVDISGIADSVSAVTASPLDDLAKALEDYKEEA